MKNVIFLSGFFFLVVSCVPSKKYNELLAEHEATKEALDQYKTKSINCEEENKDLKAKVELYKNQIADLKSDTTEMGEKFRDLQTQYDKIAATNVVLEKKFNELQSKGARESSKLIADLEKTRIALQNKEDALNQLEKELNAKERELAMREKRVQELENIIAEKDRAVSELKKRIAEALLNFEGKGLTVEQKNGKIYVSLEAKLLFPSGSTDVDDEGKKAVVELAKALENESDLEIVVEGHTDTDPIKSSRHPKNNWELSVLRATAVVEIMTNNSSISPKILSAAGRSEFHPVDPNDKAKNRRIEVIITPNLDKLFEIISSGE